MYRWFYLHDSPFQGIVAEYLMLDELVKQHEWVRKWDEITVAMDLPGAFMLTAKIYQVAFTNKWVMELHYYNLVEQTWPPHYALQAVLEDWGFATLAAYLDGADDRQSAQWALVREAEARRPHYAPEDTEAMSLNDIMFELLVIQSQRDPLGYVLGPEEV